MRAVRIHQYGGSENLVLEEISRPEPADDEVLVAVHAAGVNPIDWKLREGYARERLPLQMPAILGTDISGVVEAVGSRVGKHKVGDAVFSMLGLFGAYAEYVVVPAELVAPKPKNLTHLEAASVPLAALTAWQALFVQGGLKEGQRVLIHAGAGGVGGFAVQLAKSCGATVYATASSGNHSYVESLGADHLIDYTAGPFEQKLEDIDLVVDLVGGESTARSLTVLSEGGRLVQLVPSDIPVAELAQKMDRQASFMSTSPDGDMLSQISKLFDEQALQTNIAHHFSLAAVAAAHESSQSGRTRGKIVIDLSSPSEQEG